MKLFYQIATFALSLSITLVNAEESLKNPNHLSLTDKSIKGQIRANGLIGLFSVKGELKFTESKMIWQTDSKNQEYLPANYQLSQLNEKLRFTATMHGVNGDQVVWQGFYDGRNLSEVTARWERVKGDVVHDALLPDVVVMNFKPLYIDSPK